MCIIKISRRCSRGKGIYKNRGKEQRTGFSISAPYIYRCDRGGMYKISLNGPCHEIFQP